MPDPFLKNICSAAENINVAFYQNAVPIIRGLTLENELGRDLTDISVRLSSEPPFVTPGVWRVDRLSDKATNHLRSLDLKLDSAFLTGLTASRRAELQIVVEAEGVAVERIMASAVSKPETPSAEASVETEVESLRAIFGVVAA